MATLAPLASPGRQAFGNVDSSRLRNLANLKNCQNALAQPQPGSLKRRQPTSDSFDSENIDPSALKSSSSSKRHRGIDLHDDLAKPSKPVPFALKVLSATKATTTSIKRVETRTPRSHTPSTSISLPVSAPAVAGRSPRAKSRVGILNRRRTTSSAPYKRIEPPVFTKPTSNVGGFSIDAALSGIAPSHKSKHASTRTIEESIPAKWMFEIHEDTEDQEETNIREHDANAFAFCTQELDISDDESTTSDKGGRGKENIPPNGLEAAMLAPMTRAPAATRKNMMTDEPRTPLGDLNATDFFAEGCDESSFFVYPTEGHNAKSQIINLDVTKDTMTKTHIAALIQATAPKVEEEPEKQEVVMPEAGPTGDTFEIWESGSVEEGGSPRENIFDDL